MGRSTGEDILKQQHQWLSDHERSNHRPIRKTALSLSSVVSVSTNSNDAGLEETTATAGVKPDPGSNSNTNKFDTLVLVDVENVRGKSNFQQSHEWFVSHAMAHRKDNEGLVLVVDHGSKAPSIQTGGSLDHNVAVVMAGPNQKADDVLVDLVRQHAAGTVVPPKIVLISSDREVDGCEGASGGDDSFRVFDPATYLDQLKSFRSVPTIPLIATPGDSNDEKDLDAQHLLQKEVATRQELQMLDRMLNPRRGNRRSAKNMSRKQRTKLRARRERVKERLDDTLRRSMEKEVPTMRTLVESGEAAQVEEMVEEMQKDRIPQQIRRGVSETTYERQLLAERLKRRLRAAGSETVEAEAAASSGGSESNELDGDDAASNRVPIGILLDSMAKAEPLDREVAFTTPSRKSSGWGAQSFAGLPVKEFNPHAVIDATSISGAELSCQRIRVGRKRHDPDTPLTPIRIIVMSDTHGFEDQMELFVRDYSNNTSTDATNNTEATTSSEPASPTDDKKRFPKLPDADLIIHAGDFHGRTKRTLDDFLAVQDHIPTKVVVRGNHDPRTPGSVLFRKSNALYVTKPMTMQLEIGESEHDTLVLALRPHSRSQTQVMLPPKTDILVSHEPPSNILDLTYHDTPAGSLSLRSCVESSSTKPALWLCGHIHEGRGAMYHTFSKRTARPRASTDPTFVVNAATANSGMANRLVAGPVMIDLVDENELAIDGTAQSKNGDRTAQNVHIKPTKLLRPDSLEALVVGGFLNTNSKESTSSNNDEAPLDSTPKRLLAVDLGLNTGIAVLDGDGRVLHVQSARFTDHQQLEDGLDSLLMPWNVTQVVIEGEDRKLYHIWKRAIEKKYSEGQDSDESEQDDGDSDNDNDENKEGDENEVDRDDATSSAKVHVTRVIAEDWRRMMLTTKEERKTGEASGIVDCETNPERNRV